MQITRILKSIALKLVPLADGICLEFSWETAYNMGNMEAEK